MKEGRSLTLEEREDMFDAVRHFFEEGEGQEDLGFWRLPNVQIMTRNVLGGLGITFITESVNAQYMGRCLHGQNGLLGKFQLCLWDALLDWEPWLASAKLMSLASGNDQLPRRPRSLFFVK